MDSSNTLRSKKGFTLIELLMVFAIISILSAIALASFQSSKQKAQAARIVSDMNQLRNAMEVYRVNNPTYPNESGGGGSGSTAVTALAPLVTGGYISTIPTHSNLGLSYFFYYPNPSGIFACGGKTYTNYVIFFRYTTSQLNMPALNLNSTDYCIGG